MKSGIVLGDGGYLIELERRGYVDSGSGREKVGTAADKMSPEQLDGEGRAFIPNSREILAATADHRRGAQPSGAGSHDR